MEKVYEPQQIEKTCYQTWEKSGYFQPKGTGPAYCIMLPPPNVTGTLHMGHGFQHTLMDVLIRYQRMVGANVLWQPGTDHAGIATQMVVERQLLAQGISRHEIGRDAFIEKVWQWREKSGNQITQQLRRMGSSIDWSRERFTMDPDYSKAVQHVFIHLYEEGLIYRGKRLVNWDPVLLTAVSDLEVITEEESGFLWHIRYPLADDSGFITIATTRPETLFGDTAIAIHPEDGRYKALLGKFAKLPLTDRLIPIIADESVDPEFGTGCVKITPGHDFNDYQMGLRHDLPMLNILSIEAHLNEHVPKPYQGLDRTKAREKVLDDLTALGLLVKTENHTLKIPRGDRSGAIIEPYLTDQWFIKARPLAEPAIAAVKKGEIRFIPENWSKTYFTWMENIEDWCISRQLWWGHRIPAWYDQKQTIYVGNSEEEIREKYHLAADVILTQDNDVLDTWFSSALWPFATLDWPKQTTAFQTFYPTSVLITGFDIIFFWVARMIMLGLKFTGRIPFKEVYMTGLIRDAEGQKMSKTKGNVLDPIDLIDGISLNALLEKRTSGLMQPALKQKIEKTTRQQFPQGIPAFGTDALRFTFCALASNGRNIRFDLGRIEGYRNFCNKLWNAARFVLMNVQVKTMTQVSPEPSFAEYWVYGRLHEIIQQVHDHINHYRFDLVAQTLYEFTWNDFCDWYIEFAKVHLRPGNDAQKHATQATLLNVLETLLRLMHPLMPYITETIWQQIAPLCNIQAPSIMLQPYPEANLKQIKPEINADVEWLKHVITLIRNFRSQTQLPNNESINLIIKGYTESEQTRLMRFKHLLTSMSKITDIFTSDLHSGDLIGLIGTCEIYISRKEIMNPEIELERIDKKLIKLAQELQRAETKLSNPDYIRNAPKQIVEKERQRAIELKTSLQKLQERQQHLKQQLS